jgi:hypothetical protein
MAIGIGLFGVVHQTHLADLMWPKDSLPVLDQRLTPATTVKAGPFVTNSDGFVAQCVGCGGRIFQGTAGCGGVKEREWLGKALRLP